MRNLMLAVVIVATPAVAADQFDLVCASKKEAVRYRVDLIRGEWCQGDCTSTQRVVDATSAVLTLADNKARSSTDFDEHIIINRQSGSYFYSLSLGSSITQRNGTCSPEPFSGFPAAKF